MRLFDTHCHLQSERFDEDREEVIARSLEALAGLVIIGDDLETSRAAAALVRPGVWASVGIHPYHAAQTGTEQLDAIRGLATQPGVVAIGEIGLDYYNEFSPRPDQHRIFAAQLELAAECKLPVVIHNREADDDTLAILREHLPQLPGCIMHCFGSPAGVAETCVEMRCHVSFAGNVTFPKASALREAAAAVPLERLLVETDAPYLAPQQKRGKRCEPSYVQYTAQVLAEVKGFSVEVLTQHTTQNARKVYNIPT